MSATIDLEPALARHRRELHVHCYRMLASFDDAEDAVQETALRAWRGRDAIVQGGNVRAWLYRIATNVCLDQIRRTGRQATRGGSGEIPWLQPYPDRLLDEAAPREHEPDAVLAARETIELGFLAMIQLLPARQRAVLLMRDVLEWPAADVAAALEMTVPAVTSALQRARGTIARHPREVSEPASRPTDAEQRLLAKFIDAHERGDAAASLAIAREDIRITMPPQLMVFSGHDAMRTLLARAFGPPEPMGEWRLVPTAANRMPAAASYLRVPGDTLFRPMKFDLLRIEGGLVAETTTFGPELFPAFGLAETL